MNDVALPKPVQAVVNAINEGDTEAFVAAFSTDGRVDDWGRVLNGHDGVRSWADTDAIGMNASMNVTKATTTDDVTHLWFDWRSNRFNGTSEAYVTVADDKVIEFRIPSH
ncbi:hypothetical protein [Natronoglycomyces albus]|uniref:SnoaL-like domain-containing protein n=1 Tax=Natronoglycomyces albus TaxID=2811108 RepID=A0A895XUV4_9ACTN|nr:hypothetical protein [Natronoglycomyces albus]QSB06306.1 hypothetical protein JQS30_05195 [Natronoglycomyces albus]